jgi:outer membrane protein assembly factor BamB
VVVSTSGDGFFGLETTTGQLKWSQSWPGGTASPAKPVVAGGVVVMVDGSQQVVQAYRAETGAPLWSQSLRDGTQAREMASDGHALVVLEDAAAVALDLATGRVEWNQTLDSQSTNLLHLAGVAAGRVVIGASDWIEVRSLASGNQLALWPMASEQIALAHICLGGCADGTPQQEVAYDAATGRQLWMSSDAYWEIDRSPSEHLVGATLTRWANAAGEPGAHVVQATSGQATSSPTASGTPVFAVAREQFSYFVSDDGSATAIGR